jgi:hypothetical protein
MPASQNMFPERSFGSIGLRADPLLGAQAVRAFSTASGSSMGGAAAAAGGSDGLPTLPPHPKQKILPPPATGTGNINGGHLPNSSLLLRNAWEDKFLNSVMMTDGSRAASLAGFVPGLSGGIGGGNVGGLAALAAAQQMQNQQQQMEYAALLQKNAQQGPAAAAAGSGGGASDGDDSSKNQKDSDLQRQTTAEILLEAAGELGTNTNLPAPDKTGGLRRESTGARFLAAAQVDAKKSKREKV